MKLSTIQKKAAAKAARLGRYDISDGVHRGQITSLEYNDKNDRVYLKIQLNGENTVYKSSAELADYGNKPLNKLLEPFVDDDGMIIYVREQTKNKANRLNKIDKTDRCFSIRGTS